MQLSISVRTSLYNSNEVRFNVAWLTRDLPVSQFDPVNPAGHKQWKVAGVMGRQVALFGHGLDEQLF